jgi:uncharacterized GH25 family protein
MISILILAAAFLAQQVATPVAVTTRVEGRVINSLNGAGVPKATVILRARDQAHAQSYADETDGNGNFSLDNLDPGQYSVIAERPGFMAESTGATGAPPPILKLEKGDQVKDVKIRLTPLGVIAGRVLDMDGDPVAGATVNALRYVYSEGKRQLRTTETIQSRENGEFRLFGLRAGTFYLKAARGEGPFGQPETGVSTYYPGAPDLSHAAPVELRAGVKLEGFDIRLLPTGVYSVSFKLEEGHQPASGVEAFLLNAAGIQAGHMISFDQSDLVFGPVPPGSYEAVVSLSHGGTQNYSIKHVEVGNADVDGGTLTFLPNVELAGSVRVEGGAFSGLTKVRIHLQSPYPAPFPGNALVEVQPDGSFHFKNAAPLVYEVSVNRLAGVYLKSVRMGDKQLADRRMDLGTSKVQPLVVVLGADVGEVEGTVQNAKGDPVVRARVNVIADGDHSNRTDLNHFTFTNEKGEFRLRSVPPGDYKVFAWEDVPVGAPQDPEFRKPFEKQAVSIKLQPNGHEKVSVTAIVAAQVDRSSQ